MALELKTACERCDTPLSHTDEAYICSYECTWCPTCTTQMDHTCPNCNGELLRRPKRAA